MIDRLRESGIPALPRDHFGVLRHRHIYLGNDWIADATWQQRYSDTRKNTLRRLWHFRSRQIPRVLIARIPDLSTLLPKYGVTPFQGKAWIEAEVGELGSKLYSLAGYKLSLPIHPYTNIL